MNAPDLCEAHKHASCGTCARRGPETPRERVQREIEEAHALFPWMNRGSIALGVRRGVLLGLEMAYRKRLGMRDSEVVTAADIDALVAAVQARPDAEGAPSRCSGCGFGPAGQYVVVGCPVHGINRGGQCVTKPHPDDQAKGEG